MDLLISYGYLTIITILCGYSIFFLMHKKTPLSLPLLLCSLVVGIWSFTKYFNVSVLMAWFAFTGAVISGKRLQRFAFMFAILTISILFIRTGFFDGRKQWVFTMGEYATIGILACALMPPPLPALAILLTGARSAWVGVGLAFVRRFINRWWAYLAIFLVTVGLIFLRSNTVIKRFIVWDEAARIFLTSPWIGYGTGSYSSLARFQPTAQHADNFFLTTLVEFGMIGTSAFVYLSYEINRLLKSIDSSMKLVLMAVLFMQLVDATLYFIPTAMMFGLCLSIALDQE
jgi:hypothetical protein